MLKCLGSCLIVTSVPPNRNKIHSILDPIGRAARVTEQLDAAQAVNSEMESELRRLRVQSDQWRKAAEAAAAALSGNNNGRLVERSGSLDPDYNSIGGKMMNSPFSDDLEFESPKKKNSGVLRRMSGLWKKSPK